MQTHTHSQSHSQIDVVEKLQAEENKRKTVYRMEKYADVNIVLLWHLFYFILFHFILPRMSHIPQTHTHTYEGESVRVLLNNFFSSLQLVHVFTHVYLVNQKYRAQACQSQHRHDVKISYLFNVHTQPFICNIL